MANEQYAFLDKSNVPDRDAWQSAITECGFDLQLDSELKVGDQSGYAACRILNTDAGVEIYFDDDADFIKQFADIATNKNYCISFRWGGSMVECACAMVLSYALAKHYSAIVSYEGEPPYDNLGDFLAETQAIIKDAEKE